MLSALLGVWGAGTAKAVTGTGKITCDGDGTLLLSGDFTELSVSTQAGALVVARPSRGTVILSSGARFVKYTSGDTTLYIGNGSATAKNVKGIKLTLSGANAHLEALGTGKLAVRGEGACTTASGKTWTWKPSQDTTWILTP